MPLPANWATPEDATLFQYLWHRDFPIDAVSIGANRSDWTIHIGMIVRTIADLMGLAPRFERRGRIDGVLVSHEGDEIAAEWEWNGVWGNNKEIDHLKDVKIWNRDKGTSRNLKYAVLITYTHTPNITKVYEHVQEKWTQEKYPLLLILIDLVESKKFTIGKEFNNIQMAIFRVQEPRKELRVVPACPWAVESTRWHSSMNVVKSEG